MKKTFYYLLAGLTCVSLTFSACGDDDSSNPGGGQQYDDAPYSDLTPEQQKDKLGAEANAFLNQLQGVENQEAIDVMDALGALLNESETLPNIGGTVLNEPQDINNINQFYGEFTYNPADKTWTETPAQALSLNFPVGNETAKIAISGVSSGSVITFEEYYSGYDTNGEWVSGTITTKVDMPKELTATITLAGKTVGNISLKNDIAAGETIPNSSSMSFGMGEFTFAQSADKNGNTTASLKKGNTVLMSLNAKMNGELSEDMDESDIEGGNFQMKLMNLVLAGNIDYANLNKEEAELDARCFPQNYWEIPAFNYELAEETYAKGYAEIFNKYADYYLVSTEDNTKIAKLTQKAVSTTDDYGYTYWDTTPMLEFGDGTQVEAEVYFSSGFEMLLENFDNFVAKFQ
jgi:hypothetical protein